MGEENQSLDKQPKAKGKIRRSYLVAAVVVLVLAIGGGGFWVWHSTPEFCDAICHTPQDPYNPTYYAEPGQARRSRWDCRDPGACGKWRRRIRGLNAIPRSRRRQWREQAPLRLQPGTSDGSCPSLWAAYLVIGFLRPCCTSFLYFCMVRQLTYSRCPYCIVRLSLIHI